MTLTIPLQAYRAPPSSAVLLVFRSCLSIHYPSSYLPSPISQANIRKYKNPPPPNYHHPIPQIMLRPTTTTTLIRRSNNLRTLSTSAQLHKVIPEAIQTTPGNRQELEDNNKNMDGDRTAKKFDSGANSAIKETELSGGIHESSVQRVSEM